MIISLFMFKVTVIHTGLTELVGNQISQNVESEQFTEVLFLYKQYAF